MKSGNDGRLAQTLFVKGVAGYTALFLFLALSPLFEGRCGVTPAQAQFGAPKPEVIPPGPVAVIPPPVTAELVEVNSFLEWHRDKEHSPEGERELAAVRRRFETMLSEELAQGSTDILPYYLEVFPANEYRAVGVRLEPFSYQGAIKRNDVEGYEHYLSFYTGGGQHAEILKRYEPLLFQEAQRQDWHSDYAAYLKRYPNGPHAAEARERLAWLRRQKVNITIDFPEQVVSRPKEGDEPSWEWTTKFVAGPNTLGFRLLGSGYITDPRGNVWGSALKTALVRNAVRVANGAEGGQSSTSHGSQHHELCGGVAEYIWEGEDAGGHKLVFKEKVKLVHPNCPGFKGE